MLNLGVALLASPRVLAAVDLLSLVVTAAIH